MSDRFVVPPFTVLDTRQGYWRERDAVWHQKIGDTGQAREDSPTFGQFDPSVSKSNGVSILNPTLCELIVRWFMPDSERGVNCFDCFAGGTAFGFVSGSLGKQYIGIELRKEQVDFNLNRFKEYGLPSKYICDDGRNVAMHIPKESQDLLFSCPPYFDLEKYSNDPRDASNQESYEDFRNLIDEAFTSAIGCLKPNRFAAIVIGDVRDKRGAYLAMPNDIIDIFRRGGMMLYNHAIIVNNTPTAAVRASGNMATRKLVTTHQEVLVFYKGNPKGIKADFSALEIIEDEYEV